jgi:succinate dehydrogenase flavin-adding protein (antitoxin of CptAB toxin-antitoxin module)
MNRTVAKLSKRVVSGNTVRFFNSSVVARYTAPVLTGLSCDQEQKVEAKNNELRTRHVKLEATMDPVEKDAARRKRMIYRSKQRGWLEADILMGSWAVLHVPGLTTAQLDEYELILNEETIDIFNYITGKDALPERLQNLGLMKDLQQYALHSRVFDPESYEAVKRKANLT